MVEVQVVYAAGPQTEQQSIVRVSLPEASTVAMAIHASGITTRHPEIDVSSTTIGIFNRLVSPNDTVSNHDRIEIYRPLAIDPKEARRARCTHCR